MFNGIVTAIGTIQNIIAQKGCKILVVEAPKISSYLNVGDSVSVDGVCLTITKKMTKGFLVEAVEETLKKSMVGLYKKNQKVNLETPLKIGGRISGHFVTGHVDERVQVSAVYKKNKSILLTIKMPSKLSKYITTKGSIAINGVSLTISMVAPKSFTVSLIPFTLKNTNLASLKSGDYVNIEVDILARYART